MKSKVLIAVAALAALFAACGGSNGNDAAADRTVKVEMRDIAYSIDTLDLTKGETVKFEFTNKGKLDHDAFIGDNEAQADHESSKGDGGMHHGGDSNAITVKPGKSGSLSYTFDKAGETLIGCHETGHYDDGMKIAVTVA